MSVCGGRVDLIVGLIIDFISTKINSASKMCTSFDWKDLLWKLILILRKVKSLVGNKQTTQEELRWSN